MKTHRKSDNLLHKCWFGIKWKTFRNDLPITNKRIMLIIVLFDHLKKLFIINKL